MPESKKIDILRQVLGDFHREGSSQLLFYCPRCEHHKKKLSINVEKNVFKCWVCDWSGRDLYRIIRKYGDFKTKQTWRGFSQQIEINDFAEKLFGVKKEVLEQYVELPKNFISLVNKKLPSTSIRPLNYLESRNITKADIIKWKIGYCAEGQYAGRIIIPSFSISGRVNYFVARSYDDDWRKYINPNVSRNIVFNELFIDFDEDIILVEGVFDAVKAGKNSIPLLGSTLVERSQLFQKIVKNDSSVYLALDSDAEKKTNKLIDLFLKYDVELFKVDIAPYKDVGEMSKSIFLAKKQTAAFLSSDNYLLSKIMGI